MSCDKQSLLLYAVTDRSWLRGMTLCEQVEQALQGGGSGGHLRGEVPVSDTGHRKSLVVRAL